LIIFKAVPPQKKVSHSKRPFKVLSFSLATGDKRGAGGAPVALFQKHRSSCRADRSNGPER